MVFACQTDSFLKQFVTKVVSCKEAKVSCNNKNGKKDLLAGYEVVLEDTILFPEGGGQPWDLGTIEGKEVIQVIRRGGDAVHFLQDSLDVGQTVTLQLDWNRRLDHMQQHSGQHLITAVVAAEYGYATSSWWLGEEISHLELDTPSMSADQVSNVENLVNQYIREGKPVTVKVHEADDPELKKARTRGLPEDHVGLVRIVSIENLENNMCCGTHVSNLSQLQMIKLTGVEKGKKGKIKLNFLAGNRILNKMAEFLEREAALSNILQNKGSMHVQLTEKIQDTLKNTVKSLQTVLREFAAAEAEKLKNTVPKPRHFILHRKEAEMDFINTFLREFSDQSILVLIIIGEEPNLQIMLHGDPVNVGCVGPRLCDIMGGKGFGKGSKFQAKVAKLKLPDIQQLLKEVEN